MVVTFDTLKAARRLQDEAGFDEKQAAVLVSTFAEGISENLATKTDLAVLRSDLKEAEARLRAEMRQLEQRVYVRRHDQRPCRFPHGRHQHRHSNSVGQPLAHRSQSD